MSELLGAPPLPRAESQRRGDESSSSGGGGWQLQAAETERRQPEDSALGVDEHRPSSTKPAPAEPRKQKPRAALPPALVLSLRVALTLSALAVPAIFLQNSGRRSDPFVAAVVTLECVS